MSYHSKWEDLPTEKINPDTLGIDTMPVLDIVDLFGAEDRKVVSAVHKERERIARGVEIIVTALKKGGRVFLVGAGTSGRLGVLEAAEMPPTFGTSKRGRCESAGNSPGSNG
jgi:N-acetylmuramic acid 6-phosphate etherase